MATQAYNPGEELIGRRVITRSNEDEPAHTGTLVGWWEIHERYFPLIRFDDTGKEFMVMSVVLPYNDGLLTLLNSMPYKDAWKLAYDISITNQVVHRMSDKH